MSSSPTGAAAGPGASASPRTRMRRGGRSDLRSVARRGDHAGVGAGVSVLPARPVPLQRIVEAQARMRPDHPAVEMAGRELTYGEIDTRANRLARALRASGCRPGDRVCFLLHKSPEAIVTILGILKAGCAYVPLDPESPPPRLRKMMGRADPRILVAADETRRLVLGLVRPDAAGVPLSVRLGWLGDDPPEVTDLEIAFTRFEVDARPPTPPEMDAGGEAESTERAVDRPAYVFFTSGSTGQPKGVVITHANVYHFVRWGVEYFGIGPDDRNSGHAPLHFDLSTFDIFGTFAAGATLHLVPPGLNLHPRSLAEWIRRRELTQWFSVPTVLSYMASFGVVRSGAFPSLERVIWCGEVLPTPTLQTWMEHVPHAAYTNLYGPTEATVASSYYTVPTLPRDPLEEIPIGTPCAGERLYVLDDDLRPVPPGRVGHLYIGGVGLSTGYWRDEEKTREAFVDAPPEVGERIYRTGDLACVGEDGLFRFRSREDSQVKVRGHRIELGEIESAAYSLDGIREAAVVTVDTGGFQGMELACAYVARGQVTLEPARIRSRLGALLPPYMLPSRWMELDELPRNRNGKVDRPELRERFRERLGLDGKPGSPAPVAERSPDPEEGRIRAEPVGRRDELVDEGRGRNR